MSSKKSNKKNTEKSAPMPAIDLKNIVDAGPDGMYVPAEIAKPLAEAGFIDVHPVPNEAGEVAVRATAAGIAQVGQAVPGTVEIAPVAVAAPAFKIEDAVPIPAPIGRGRSGSKYPFDALEVGQSFFVPDSAEQPDAAASLASTVSGATQRYATDHATETKTVKGKTVPKKVYSRKFALRKVEGGARVWRVEVTGLPE